ncbi:hypothetical protein [Streptomyces luteireticuli]|uniref:MFS transporter n=1 Tax=Streptomyces luteireticuli TaxID=173858 RepID=A0ABP3IYD5_9ACTN
MVTVAALLLTDSLAVGAVPVLARGVGGAAQAFTDHGGYAAVVLDGRTAAPDGVAAWWSWSGAGFGLLSAVLAAGIAAVAVRRALAAGAGLPAGLVLWPGG